MCVYQPFSVTSEELRTTIPEHQGTGDFMRSECIHTNAGKCGVSYVSMLLLRYRLQRKIDFAVG